MRTKAREAPAGSHAPRSAPQRALLTLRSGSEADSRNPLGIAELAERLRFCPEDGQILLGERRMALIHAQSLASLRRELIDSFGFDTARGLLTRMGYASGGLDADVARRIGENRTFVEAFLAGPRLAMLEGLVCVDPVNVEIDVEKGHYFGEFLWINSLEVDSHFMNYGLSGQPVCWVQLGYAAGYTSVFLGMPILYREVECRGTGATRCRIIGKPVEEWGEDPEDLRHFQSEAFVNRSARQAEGHRSLALALPCDAPEGARLLSDSDEMVGLSAGFNAACHLVSKVAETKATVLFLGETGVGKELFARNLHKISDRSSGPFVAVNCAAIPDTLIESELFGVEKGAYTGAVSSRPGRFERAHGGTLFLDEIGTLSASAQAKLLRTLQTGEIERVGDTRTRHVDIRLVGATHEDLKAKVRDGSFRSDLFYRLNVFPIQIPPLRERRDDLPLLMRYFVAKFARLHRRRITGFTERAVLALLDYHYPGNIRELENMLERAVILSVNDAPLDVYLLFPDGGAPQPRMGIDVRGNVRSAPSDLDRMAKQALASSITVGAVAESMIRAAVEETGGNLSAAARKIGLTRAQLAYRLKIAERRERRRATAR